MIKILCNFNAFFPLPMGTKKKLLALVGAFIFSYLLMPGPTEEVQASGKANGSPHLNERWLKKKMDLICNARTIEEVLKEVAAFYQTKIIYQAKMADVTVQCDYKGATVEQIVNRIFAQQNRAVTFEYVPERKIIVQVFGESNYNVVSSSGTTKTENLPFLADKTNKDLVRMQNEQYAYYQKELANKKAIVPGVGLTRQDLTNLHRKQNRKYELLKNDPDSIVAGTTITRRQLQMTHEMQLKLYEQDKSGHHPADPFTGLTRSELNRLHKQQIEHSSEGVLQ